MTDFSILNARIREANLNDQLKRPRLENVPKPKSSDDYGHLGNIFHLFDQLDDYSYERLKLFPKEEKFLLTSEIKECHLTIERILVEVYMKYHKKTSITSLDIEIEILRKYITRGFRRKYISESTRDKWLRKVNLVCFEVQSVILGLEKVAKVIK